MGCEGDVLSWEVNSRSENRSGLRFASKNHEVMTLFGVLVWYAGQDDEGIDL